MAYLKRDQLEIEVSLASTTSNRLVSLSKIFHHLLSIDSTPVEPRNVHTLLMNC